jgi:hypothetical protein
MDCVGIPMESQCCFSKSVDLFECEDQVPVF